MKFIKISGPKILDILINYDKDNIPISVMKKAKKFFEKYPDVEQIRSKNKATASIYIFMKALYKYRLICFPVAANKPNEIFWKHNIDPIKEEQESNKPNDMNDKDIPNKDKDIKEETNKEGILIWEVEIEEIVEETNVSDKNKSTPSILDQFSPIIENAKKALHCVDK